MAGPNYNQGISKNKGTGGKNLRDVGYPSSSSGYVGSSAPKYNQGISRATTPSTNYGQRSVSTGATRSSGSGSGSVAQNNSAANAYNALLAAYQQRQSAYEDYLAQMRAAAQEAYDRGMNALNSAYDNQMSSLSKNLAETKNQLLNTYNRSRQNISDDAGESLKQAYINKMKSERNLGQQLSAAGLSGGATESTMAGMLNNYGNARNEINTTENKNLSNLEGNYNDNISQAMQAYNSAVANANLQKAQQAIALENALASNKISSLSDYQSMMSSQNDRYLDLLKTAIANGANFTFDPTAANNTVQAMAVQQAVNPLINNSNYAALEALANAQQAPGQSANTLSVVNPVAQNNYLAAILSQLR